MAIDAAHLENLLKDVVNLSKTLPHVAEALARVMNSMRELVMRECQLESEKEITRERLYYMHLLVRLAHEFEVSGESSAGGETLLIFKNGYKIPIIAESGIDRWKRYVNEETGRLNPQGIIIFYYLNEALGELQKSKVQQYVYPDGSDYLMRRPGSRRPGKSSRRDPP